MLLWSVASTKSQPAPWGLEPPGDLGKPKLADPSLGAGGQLAGVGSLNLYASTGQWRLVSPIPGPDERLVEGVSSHPLAVSAQAEERWTGEVSSMLP